MGKQLVNVPFYLVQLDSEKQIDFTLKSPLGGGRPGRVARKKAQTPEGGLGGEEEEEEEEWEFVGAICWLVVFGRA